MRSRLQTLDWTVDGVGVAIVVGLGLIAYITQVGPAIGRHQVAAASETQLAEAQSALRELDRTISTLQAQIATAQREVQQHSIALESAGQLNARLARLTELAAQSRLRVDSIEPGTMIRFERYSVLSIRMSGQGSYRSCSDMLRRIRSDMPDMGVMGLRLSTTPTPGAASASFQFDLIWHTQPEPAKK